MTDMTTTTTQWSDYQRAIFADVAEGTGHTVVIARAGSGKTTSIMEAMRHVPSGRGFGLSVAMFAFNKVIAQELQARAPRGVRVATLHSFGFAAVRRAFGAAVQVDGNKSRKLLDEVYPPPSQDRQWCSAVAKTASLAKGMLVEDRDGIEDIVDQFGIDAGVTAAERETFVKDVLWLLERSAQMTMTIDFDDMVWFPIKHDLRVEQFDRVFVDETQDLNAAQLELTMRACKPSGRICAVGDDKQACYGFRGAAQDAVQRVVDGLGAKVLLLSITYRCGKAIAALAATEVADFAAADTNPEGMVGECGRDEMFTRVAPGDFILSRTNAPLIKHCLALLQQGRAANIAGRDVGAGLIALVDRAKAKDVDELLAWLAEWSGREVARRLRKDPEADVQDIEDRAACIEALCEGETVVAVVRARIESLFTDKTDGERIVLSTTHKAKGLERDRVFMLADTYRRSRKGQAPPSQEERNLWYVAVTRARHELWMVRGEGAS